MELVTVITPTTHDRDAMNKRIRRIIAAQDYPYVEHIFAYGTGSIGLKRNLLCAQAKGEIILHADSDDYYATDWISKSIEALGDNDLTGINRAFFYRPHTHLWEYNNQRNQRYVIGASMCYRKSMWERNKFREDIRQGEDAYFCQNSGHIMPHDYHDGFCAILHGSNTASHLQTHKMIPLQPDYAKHLLKDRYDEYGQ